MMKTLIALGLALTIGSAYAQEEIFYVEQMTQGEIARLAHEIGGKQGECVYINVIDFKEHSEATVIFIPEDSHGVEFHVEYELRLICSRFSEDYYDHDGTFMDSIDYDDIGVYND